MARTPQLRERLAKRFARSIADGAWPAGAWLPTERELAAQAEVSRGLVRQALETLAVDGAIERIPHRGWRRPPAARGFERVLMVLHGGHDREVGAGLRSVLEPAGVALETAPRPSAKPIHGWTGSELSRRAITAGAVVVFTEYGLPEAWWRELDAAGVRTICLGSNLHLPYDTVCADFAAMSRDLVRAIHARGHSAIAFCGQANLHRDNPAFRARVLGYQQCMRDLGLRPAVGYLGGDFDHDATIDAAFERWFAEVEAAIGSAPTCLYVSGSRYVARIAAVLQRLGKRVPEDVSLAGFGVSREVLLGAGKLFDSALHVPEPWFAIGAAAGARLVARQRADLPPALTLVPSALVDGSSVRTIR